MKSFYRLSSFALGAIIILFFNTSAFSQAYDVTLPIQCNQTTGGDEILIFNNVPPNASGDATLTFTYNGDLNGTPTNPEFITFIDELGATIGQSNATGQCAATFDSVSFIIPFATVLNWTSDGTVTITADGDPTINNICSGNSFCVIARLQYPVTTAPNDIGVSALDSPGVFCAGNQNIYAQISNYGTNQVNNFTVNWAFNGVLETPIPVTQLLDTANGSGSTQTSIFLGTKNITDKDTIEVWTSSPNGATDTVTANDSLYRVLTPSLNGNLVVGSSIGADYANFSSLVTDLNAVGVCGPVNVSVEPGTYNEFIDLGPIVGISSTNTLTIDGGDTSLVNITHDGSVQSATIKLAGADWVTLKNMTISSTSTGFDSWGILLMMGADHNTIDSCNIVLPISSNDDRSGILASSSETTDFGEGNNANYTTVSNCVITGGDRNITFEGGTAGSWNVGNKFINNTLRFADDFGFYGDEQDSLVFQGNTISDIQQTINGDGFYSFDFENLTLRENIINVPDWAVYCADLNVDGIGGNSVIANNFITSNNDYGLYIIDGENVDIFHNTIFGEPAIYLDYSFDGLDSLDVRNNIFISNNDNAFEIDVNTGTTGVTTLDNNIYETSGTSFVVWEGTPYPDLITWQSSFPQFNAGSYEGDPIFFAPGDFHVVGPLANNQGSPTPILIDLDGDPRSATIPDIGADEYALITDDAGVVSIDSPSVFCPGSFDVYARIANFGTNQISSATVNWAVDGVLQSPASFSGLLDTLGGTGSRFGLVLLGNFNFATNNPYLIEAWTTNPNGNADLNSTNDSLETAIQSNLPPPTNINVQAISSSQATLGWTGGSANTWLWGNVLSGQVFTGNGTPVASASVTVTGLTPKTAYDFYVREVCASGDTSAWAGPFTYTTPFFCPPNAYCFTHCGGVGHLGPTQGDCNSAYNGTNLSGQVTVNGGIQEWNVPGGGLYEIEVSGAQGFGTFGGRGARMKGEFLFSGGETIKILVGQKGAPPVGAGTNQFGGGGGTFITDNANNPLIIAGGGGGSWATAFTNITDAPVTTAGNSGGGTGSTGGAGGTAGQGGSTAISADGGGGLLGNGTGTAGGFAFVNGGNGGLAPTNGGEGGFGGGGGASSWNNRRGGGGGGYSGGGGSHGGTTGFPEAGGGGSFNAGTNQFNIAGANIDDGTVIIRPLSSGAPNDVGIVGIDSPAVFCPGTEDVWATINNYGTTQVTTVTVDWSVDGVLQPTVTFNGNLDTIGGTGATTGQILLGSFSFSTNNPYNVSVWTSNPNGMTDTVGQNDTASRVVQSSLPPPTGLAVNNLFSTQGDMSWNPGALANSWLWVNVPAGNLPSGIGTASSTPNVTVTGLTQNTSYDFYVREVCPSGDTSAWAGPLSYTTPCAIYIAPFFEAFDGPAWSLTSPFDIDQCWNKTTTTAPFWRTEDLTTGSGSTGPAGDVSGTGKYVYMETSGGSVGQTSELESPPIDISGLSAPQVEFYYHMYGATMGTLNLDVLDSAGNWVNIWTLSGPQQNATTDPWVNVAVPFTPSTDTVQFRFQGVRGTSFTGDMSVDEVRLRDAPNDDLALTAINGLQTACGLGSNESFTVDVENKGANTQNVFDIEYSVNGGPFIIGASASAPLAFAQTQTYTISGVDLSGPGQKCIDVRVVLAGDEDSTNNSLPQLCIFNQAVPTIDSIINGEVCNGGSVTLQVLFTGDNLNWYDDAALTNQVNSGSTYTANFTQTTVLYIQAINSNGCTAPIQTITAEVNFTPTVNFTQSVNNCTVDFTGLVSNNTDSVRWTFGDPLNGTSTQINPTYVYASAQSFLITLTAYDGTCSKDTTKAVFVNCQGVGLNSNSWTKEISLFPNPSAGNVTFDIPNTEEKVLISVIDIKGQEVFRQEYSTGNKFNKVVDLSYLDAGQYFVNMYSGDRSAVKKLTIE